MRRGFALQCFSFFVSNQTSFGEQQQLLCSHEHHTVWLKGTRLLCKFQSTYIAYGQDIRASYVCTGTNAPHFGEPETV